MGNTELRTEAIFSANLVWLMRRNNETQAEMARACGIDPGNISQYVRMRALPSLQNIMLIAQHYGVTIEDLITYHARLDRCPFCGAEAEIHEDGKMYFVYSNHELGCYLENEEHTYYITGADAAEAWNRRAD